MCEYMYASTYAWEFMLVYVYLYMHICINALFAYMYVCMYVRICICLCIFYVCVCDVCVTMNVLSHCIFGIYAFQKTMCILKFVSFS